MHTNTFYNPKTNKISGRWVEGFENCGSRKFAEAMTKVDEDERPLLWNNRIHGIIDVANLPSKTKHKLLKIGIKEYSPNYIKKIKMNSDGEVLLDKIMLKQGKKIDSNAK